MKNIWCIALLSALSFSACEKETQELTDDLLSQQIAFSENKIVVAYYDLPAAVLTYVEDNYFETYIETVYSVAGTGFEVILGSEDVLYSSMSGRVLDPKRGPFSQGPCGRGELVGLDKLPNLITSFISKNYTGAKILKAKLVQNDQGGIFYVKIDKSRGILIFKADGTFLEATVLFYHCRPLGMPIELARIPAIMKDYIAKNLPGAEIKVAFRKANGVVIIGIITPDGRRIVGFSADGTFLWIRP